MRLAHFEALAPICPRCRQEDPGQQFPLAIASEQDSPNHVTEGLLQCSNPACQLEFPVIDGIPVIVPDPRTTLSEQVWAINARDDLAATTRSILGDAASQGSAYDLTRHYLSTYGWDAFAEFGEGPEDAFTAGFSAACLARGLELSGPLSGPVIDLGCSVGRTTFELARHTDGLVLGIDLNFSMLQLAQQVSASGVAELDVRRQGVVYDRRRFETPFAGQSNVDFWLCDACALPFADATFGSATALNLLDCVSAPIALLEALDRTLRQGARAILSTPYDWSVNATPIEAWIGGHSQRGDHDGNGEALLRKLLTPGAHPQSAAALTIVAELDDVPWQTRLHARSAMRYVNHLLVVEKRG